MRKLLNMVQLHLFIHSAQMEALREMSFESGKPVSSIVRDAIAIHTGSYELAKKARAK